MRIVHFYLFFIIVSFISINPTFGTNRSIIDSLEIELKKAKEDKAIPILGQLSKAYFPVDLNRSLNYAGKALELSEKYKDKLQTAFSNIYIADIYFEMNRYQPAIEFYEKALDYFYEQKASDNKIYIYTKLGHAEKMLGNYNNALFYYQKPLNLYLAEHDNKISEAYNNIGIVYKLKGELNEAFKYHQQALNAANLALDQNEIANTLNYIGSLYWSKSQYDSSLLFFEKSLEIYREITDSIGEANILTNIGTVYKNLGEFKMAIDFNQKALEIRMIKGHRKDIAKSYNNIGSIYLATNDIDKAIEFYLLSLKIRENISDIFGIAQTQNNIALVYKRLNKNEEALSYFNKSLNNYSNIGNLSLIANSINQIGTIYKKINKYDLALENYLKALKIQQELKNQDKIASILNNIGIIYDDINNSSKALESYSRALDIKRETGNKQEIAYSLHVLGNSYHKLKNYNEALKHYNESLNLRLEVGDKVTIANSYKSIGKTYMELSDYVNSISNLNKAHEIRVEIGDMKGLSDILNDIGNYYFKINKLDQSLDYYFRALDICNKTNDQLLKGLCLRKVGAIQLIQGSETNGIDNINESLHIGQNIDNLELIKNAYFELFQYFNKKGSKDKALENYLNYTIVKDSILAKLNSQRLIEIQMNFELEKSHNEISRIENEVDELTAKNRIRDLELKKQKNVRNLLLIIVLLTLTSGVLIFSQYISKRKTNVLLNEKIIQVDQSNKKLKDSEENLKILNATKDKFFSIIAHDLRNPFNALHGLTQHLYTNYDEFDSNEIKQSLELIHNSSDDLLELLENLLHWARSQRGKMLFSPKEIILSDIINKTFNLLQVNADKKDISLISEVEQGSILLADYDMLTAILRNLISNAIKFSNSNSFIRISSKEFKEYTEISVMDNGVGISNENMNKLFRIDVHHSTSGTSEEQGSGLGLILCREFVEKHNGKIWVESEINNLPDSKAGGSTFKFTIPKNTQT
ncbi:MAG: tetratricopeptide repeat-containing sensor histidine kinase [Bacteroidales bacterium]|jgi:signal transduction histidine kinase/Tfp pilus assembly protein PilF|nr:tetratricopeptide repeat-containing sensor histidine kinase [Bacteroidales bacterium]